jgi:hypothetical protein
MSSASFPAVPPSWRGRLASLAALPLRLWLLRIASLALLLLCGLCIAYLMRLQALNPVPSSAAEMADWPVVPIEVLHVLDGRDGLDEVEGPVPSPAGGLAALVQPQPVLSVRFVDHRQQVMEFPVPWTWPVRRSAVLDEEAWRKLPGCMGYVRGQDLHGMGMDGRFRIWELHCGPVHRSFDDFQAAYAAAQAEGPIPAHGWWWGLAVLLVLTVLAWLPWGSRRAPVLDARPEASPDASPGA